MEKYIVLDLGQGDLYQQGFPQIKSTIFASNQTELSSKLGSLPPAPALIESQQTWQHSYRVRSRIHKSHSQRAIKRKERRLSNVSEAKLGKSSQNLEQQLNAWLESDEFREIERQLYNKTEENEKIRVITITDDPQTRALFWHLWRFFKDRPYAEFALSISQQERDVYGELRTIKSQTPLGQVRILAVFGDDTGIDLKEDQQALRQLPHAEVVPLFQPTRKQLSEKLWDKRGWDIVFFAGHSESEDKSGYIKINAEDHLSPQELRKTIQNAVARGLQLAIINSCQGLGIGHSLDTLSIPQSVIMHENVPNKVAVEFVKNFLKEFSQGESLYLSVRRAREQLESLEDKFYCASWLPVICQNPTINPPTWKWLRDRGQFRPLIPLLASSLVTALLVGIRALGGMQGLELATYDHLIRSRPPEPVDERLLLVVGNESNDFPVPDQTLTAVIEKLNQYNPSLIGIDIFREKPKLPDNSDYAQLMKQFEQNDHLIAICTHQNSSPALPPPQFFQDNFRPTSVAHVNLPTYKNRIVRKIALFMTPGVQDPCYGDHHLATLLGFRYLNKQGIKPQQINKGNQIKVGDAIFAEIPRYTGLYGKNDSIGYQVLLNYRAYDPNRSEETIPFRQVTFNQVLDDQVNSDWVQDKIVLVGIKIPDQDRHLTPYGKSYGMMIVAHSVSEILSAVLDQRPLLRVFNVWQDIIFVFGSALIGGSISWYCRRTWLCGVATGSAVIILYLSGQIVFSYGFYIPLFFSSLSLVTTSGVIFCYKLWEDFKYMRSV